MAQLLACPFCRELFSKGEADHCPVCGVALAPLAKLPPSAEVLAEAEASRVAVDPDEQQLPWGALGRGRGLLAAMSLFGVASFVLLPWVEMISPYDEVFSGFDLARRGAGWLWGGAVGWFILLPLVISRGSVTQMRGVRIIAVFLAGLTLVEVVTLVTFPPRGNGRVPYEWHWNYGIYVSAALSAAAAFVAWRFGGRASNVAHQRAPLSPMATSDQVSADPEIAVLPTERESAEVQLDKRTLH